jgi:hypothetical protein
MLVFSQRKRQLDNFFTFVQAFSIFIAFFIFFIIQNILYTKWAIAVVVVRSPLGENVGNAAVAPLVSIA